jgi:membrane protease subunit HflK
VLQAQGDAARFQSVYQSYEASQDVTARRLYIETMESILKNTNKVVIDRAASSSGVLPYLPLPAVPASPAPAPATPAPAATSVPTPSSSGNPRGGTR